MCGQAKVLDIQLRYQVFSVDFKLSVGSCTTKIQWNQINSMYLLVIGNWYFKVTIKEHKEKRFYYLA